MRKRTNMHSPARSCCSLQGTDQYNDLFAPEREEKVQTYIAQMVNPLLYRAAKKEARGERCYATQRC